MNELPRYETRPKPRVPKVAQKRMILMRDAIGVCEDLGRDEWAAGLRDDLAYLEGKYRGQPLEA